MTVIHAEAESNRVVQLHPGGLSVTTARGASIGEQGRRAKLQAK